jgi:hypothetical protein
VLRPTLFVLVLPRVNKVNWTFTFFRTVGVLYILLCLLTLRRQWGRSGAFIRVQ